MRVSVSLLLIKAIKKFAMKNNELIDFARSFVGEVFVSNSNGSSAGRVGAALLTAKGNIYSGICLDYACSLGFCAEHAAVAEMLKHRETRIIKIVAVDIEKVRVPCGRCRELIMLTNFENRNTDIIISHTRTIKLSDLLPYHWLES